MKNILFCVFLLGSSLYAFSQELTINNESKIYTTVN